MGYYCTAGTSQSLGFPCKGGEYCPDNYSKEYNGGFPFTTDKKCNAGYFCSSKATKPTPAGPHDAKWTTCAAKKASKVLCEAAGPGCKYSEVDFEGSKVEKACVEPDDSFGGFCPKGNYCGLGATNPTPCGASTFMPHRGGKVLNDC